MEPGTCKCGYERGKTGLKHLKTKRMENISIKVHPPWYARGTPVTSTRDGPPMALSDKPLFAIREGPSARGKPPEISRLWLTSFFAVFNAQNSMYSRRCAMLGRNTDLSACAAPDNVKMEMEDVKMELNEGLVGDFETIDDFGTVNADRSGDAVRSEKRTIVDFDLSACAVPDNVKMEMEENVKMKVDDNVKLKWLTLTGLLTLSGRGMNNIITNFN